MRSQQAAVPFREARGTGGREFGQSEFLGDGLAQDFRIGLAQAVRGQDRLDNLLVPASGTSRNTVVSAAGDGTLSAG